TRVKRCLEEPANAECRPHPGFHPPRPPRRNQEAAPVQLRALRAHQPPRSHPRHWPHEAGRLRAPQRHALRERPLLPLARPAQARPPGPGLTPVNTPSTDAPPGEPARGVALGLLAFYHLLTLGGLAIVLSRPWLGPRSIHALGVLAVV